MLTISHFDSRSGFQGEPPLLDRVLSSDTRKWGIVWAITALVSALLSLFLAWMLASVATHFDGARSVAPDSLSLRLNPHTEPVPTQAVDAVAADARTDIAAATHSGAAMAPVKAPAAHAPARAAATVDASTAQTTRSGATAEPAAGAVTSSNESASLNLDSAYHGSTQAYITTGRADETSRLSAERRMSAMVGVVAPNDYRFLTKEELFARNLNQGKSPQKVYFLPTKLFKDGAPNLTMAQLVELSDKLEHALLVSQQSIVHFGGPGGILADEFSIRNFRPTFSFDLSAAAVARSQGRAKHDAQALVDEGIVAVTLGPRAEP